jgi:hypothetical protein
LKRKGENNMLTTFVLLCTLMFTQSNAYLGEDMTDEEFRMLVMAHEQFKQEYGRIALKSALVGGIKGVRGGPAAIAASGSLSAIAAVAGQMLFDAAPEKIEEVRALMKKLYSVEIEDAYDNDESNIKDQIKHDQWVIDCEADRRAYAEMCARYENCGRPRSGVLTEEESDALARDLEDMYSPRPSYSKYDRPQEIYNYKEPKRKPRGTVTIRQKY